MRARLSARDAARSGPDRVAASSGPSRLVRSPDRM